ncbi:MAG: glutamate-1-semialdehyde 2,1-aminomutase [Lentisphaeria bacterium]|nr:glutamate-1-semialdehyde 2,1-aminomutase [Lentisphaeria bacterium]
MAQRRRGRSEALWQTARMLIPGGVNSPVRAFGAVGGTPVFADHASGSVLVDVDGNRYIDYVMSWGPLILGHAPPAVIKAVREACGRGTSFGMPTAGENELAQAIVNCVPGIEKVRLVSSGTEAAMSALRLARGYTRRDFVIKFEGCYHGHVDGLLAAAGSGVATFAVPDTAGVPAGYAEKTLVAPYNDLDAAAAVFDAFPGQIAGVIVEPVAGNMGVVAPAPGFLEGLREQTRRHGALLVFDEVITGFRLGLGGAQELYGVIPDLTVLGKIIGGGLPAAAYGGRAEIMDALAPGGPVYQAGTLSGNPLAVAAGLAALRELIAAPPYASLEARAAFLAEGLGEAAQDAGIPVWQNRVGSMQTLFFADTPVTDYASAKTADARRYARFFHAMLARGVALAPSQFEACFVSTAHSEEDLERTIAAAREALREIA